MKCQRIKVAKIHCTNKFNQHYTNNGANMYYSRTLTSLTWSRLASLLVNIKTTSLCPFFTANITGVYPL